MFQSQSLLLSCWGWGAMLQPLLSHVPKVEELYEAYCIQCRLRDGATNMKQAFSLSPSTKASRESLLELYKNVQECTEDMCFIEGALEVHLGEFHVKMKGLVGFARLCPGDQYEVFVRLGRQKWRLKGKIETDDSQTWDEEEKIFIPNLHEKFEIKVTELRGLATILVGVVTCDSTNFFSTKPQAIIVDITELGTIKLRLEVLWNPFDTENLFLSPGSTAKFSVGSRKSSLYNWTPPNTPSFRERYYLSVLQQRQSPGPAGEEAQPPSILSYLAACDFDVPGRNKPHNPAETSEGDSFSSEDQKGAESRSTTPALEHRALPLVMIQEAGAEEQQQPVPGHSTLDILKKTPCGAGFPSSLPSRHSRSRLAEQENISQKSWSAAHELRADGRAKPMDRALQDVLNLLKWRGEGQAPLEKLECQVLSLRDKLKCCPVQLGHLCLTSVKSQICWSSLTLKCCVSVIQKIKKKKQYLKIWSDLAEPGSSILVTSAERFRHALKYTMMLRVKEKYPSHLETVLQRLLEQILTCEGLLPSSHFQTEPVTLFQFYRYLERHHIGSLEKHLAKLAKEVMLIEELQCPGRLKTLKRLKGKRLSRLQPLPRTLRLLGMLQLDENHRVSKAATACLARASGSGNLRARAVLFYTDALSHGEPRLQQAACLALKNLRAVESIEQVAHLCQSETEEVRNAARETTLSFGERGRQAFEKMDRICCELRETAQEAEIEITVF
uniref:RIPOR family member 3 n=1 Tax=Catharus ustulatus TaxID=91951 RepID=A0A8C3VDL2_CATUS